MTGVGRVLDSHFGPGEVSDGVRGTDASVGVHAAELCACLSDEASRVVANLEAI